MTASRRAARFLAWGLLLLAGCAFAAAPAQTVRIDVDARSTVAREAPRVFGFGGNIWLVPDVFDAGIAERILAMRPSGITRVSLGDTLLEPAADLQDLRRRLDDFPLNEFLRRYKAGGGRVLVILDGTPPWLSSSRDKAKVKGPDQPLFRMSPPVDYRAWSDVVEAVVRHFNGKLRLDAYYEAWNEPNYYYHGSTEQFMRQYYHSVLGARRADPRALVGGPGVSEFLGASTALAPSNDADKVAIATAALEQRFLWRQFLQRAAATPVPELGLERLPVDFFSWHAFYFDPARYYGIVVPVVRDALAQAGYPASTPLINSEWNIAPVPPYPEGDLNATHVGAAYAAASLIAMNEAGVDGQAFQMYVDPGGKGYYGGMFFVSGLARATFHAFALFSRMRGRQVRATSTDPWVKATAFVDGDTTYVLVASYVPTAKMATDTQALADFLANREFGQSIVRGKLVGAMVEGRLPEAQARRAREIEKDTLGRAQATARRAAERAREISLEVAIGGMRGTPRHATRFLVDSRHGNVFPEVAAALRELESRTATAGGGEAQFLRALESAGLPAEASRDLVRGLRGGEPADRALSRLPAEKREGAARALLQARAELANRHRLALAEVESGMPAARVGQTRLDWPASGPLTVLAEANSVQLFVVGP